MTYDGFISYSHAADGRLAPAVQRGLHRLAKPWHRRRALWVFRDQTGLSVTPALWSSIQNALDGSAYFVLLASPEAARSPWVNREIDHWVATKPASRILPVVTDGHWQWDTARGDFTPESTAVPDALRGVFAEEPLFLDLRWAGDDQHLTLQHSRFRDAIAQLAAPMHGISKDELEGEDVRQHRRTRRLGSAAVAALALLTVVASLAGTLAVHNAVRATDSASEARRQEQVAARQRGTAEQAEAEARRQQANAAEQQAKARDAAAETKQQEKRSRVLHATAERAAADAHRKQEEARRAKADARRHREQARRAKADARRQQQLAERQRALAEEQGALAAEQRRLAQKAERETTRQRIIAAKQQRLAEEAAAETEQQKAIAKQQRIWAEQATAEALRQEAIARGMEKRADQAAEDARRQQEKAAQQEQIAVSRRLVNEAKATVRNEPASALKLGLAAQTVQPGDEAGRELAGLVTSTRHAGVIADVSYADYGADGIVATTDTDFKASLWNVADRAHPVRLAQLDDGAFIGDPTFSPDHRTLVLHNIDPDEVILFNVANPALPVRLGTVPQPDVMSTYFSPDGHTLATVDGDGSWQLWDVTDQARPRQLSEQPMDGSFLAFSPDGRTVVTQDQPATIWDITDRTRPTRVGKLNVDWLGQLAFSSQRPLLATNDSDYRLVLWDLQQPERPRKLAAIKGDVLMLEFSDDGSTIATNDGFHTTALWDVADLSDPVQTAELPDDAGFAYSLALSPDGRTLATAGATGVLTLRNVTSYGEPNSRPLVTGGEKEGRFAALTPDGRTLTTAYSDGTATVWDLSNPAGPEPRANLQIHPDSLQTAAMNPAGDLVASLPDEPRMSDVTLTDVSDPATPVPLGNLPDAPIIGGPYGGELAFSPDGQTLAVAEVGVMLWDLADPREPVKLAYFREDASSPYGLVSALAFSPDGRILAVADERTISLWNVADRAKPVRTGTLKGHIDAVLTLAFSPDGRLLAAGGRDNKASLWTVADGTPHGRLSTMTGHDLPVYSVAFAPDGRTLATAAGDGTTLLWDVARPAGPVRLAMLHRTGHPSPWLLFSPDGHTLLSSTGRGPARTRALVWDYSALNDLRADPAGSACAIAGGSLTTEEWAAAIPEVPYRRTCPP